MMIMVVVMVVVMVSIKKYTVLRLLTPGACITQPLTLFSNIHYLELFNKFFSLVFSVVSLSPSVSSHVLICFVYLHLTLYSNDLEFCYQVLVHHITLFYAISSFVFSNLLFISCFLSRMFIGPCIIVITEE